MSRIIDILTAIRNGETYTGEPLSRVEAILKSIANKTPYTATAQSRHEQLLLAIKNGQKANGTARTRVEEILFAIANGTLESYLVGKNLVNIKDYCVSKNEEIRFADDIVYARNVVNALFFNVFIEKNKYYTAKYALESTVQDASTGKWRVLYKDGSYSSIGSHGSSVLIDKEVKNLLIYANSGTASDVILSSLKLEIGKVATPYTTYAFLSELESAYVGAANKLKGGV